MTLHHILTLFEHDFTEDNTKLVRHADTRGIYDFDAALQDREKMLEYQAEQDSHKFNCEYIISFIGLENSKSLFFGAFRVLGHEVDNEGQYHYNLEELTTFNDFKDRLVINWTNPRAWHQWFHNGLNMDVLELLPEGYAGNFSSIMDLSLPFRSLEKIVLYPEANRDWVNALKSVNGIYIILDTLTGDQYIGSASGTNGIWGRWETYIYKKGFENKRLIERMKTGKDYHLNLQFSVLQTLPSSMIVKEVVEVENLYKSKLGSKAFGLNAN